MDSFRRNYTVHQICKCGETCAQVIVFSHEPGFLKLLWDRIPPADRKTLQLARVGEENTTIVAWDIERAVQARYRADVEMLQKFFSAGEGEPRNVVQKIRPILEGYCRNLFPSLFLETDMMGVIVGKIRTAGPTHTLYLIAGDLDLPDVLARPDLEMVALDYFRRWAMTTTAVFPSSTRGKRRRVKPPGAVRPWTTRRLRRPRLKP
jgi:hypothetical protein